MTNMDTENANASVVHLLQCRIPRVPPPQTAAVNDRHHHSADKLNGVQNCHVVSDIHGLSNHTNGVNSQMNGHCMRNRLSQPIYHSPMLNEDAMRAPEKIHTQLWTSPPKQMGAEVTTSGDVDMEDDSPPEKVRNPEREGCEFNNEGGEMKSTFFLGNSAAGKRPATDAIFYLNHQSEIQVVWSDIHIT